MTTKRRYRSPAAIRRTAYHEAGHAVCGRVLHLVCGEVSIVADYEEMTAGYAITQDHFAIDSAWENLGKFRAPVTAVRG